jgi:hypothetical protein
MPVRIYQAVISGDYGTASALGTILLALTAIAVYAAFPAVATLRFSDCRALGCRWLAGIPRKDACQGHPRARRRARRTVARWQVPRSDRPAACDP